MAGKWLTVSEAAVQALQKVISERLGFTLYWATLGRRFYVLLLQTSKSGNYDSITNFLFIDDEDGLLLNQP